MTRRIGTLVPVRTKGSIKAVCVVLFVAAAACSSNTQKASPVFFVEKSTALSQGDAICKQLNTAITDMVAAFRTATPNMTQDDARKFFT